VLTRTAPAIAVQAAPSTRWLEKRLKRDPSTLVYDRRAR
jgi:hypothetical protein